MPGRDVLSHHQRAHLHNHPAPHLQCPRPARLQLPYLSAIDLPHKMRLTSKFEGVTITQKGILMCKCKGEMLERTKKTAVEPITDDDKCNNPIS